MQKTVRKLDTIKLILPKRKRVAAYVRVSSGKEAMLHSLSAQISYYCKLIQDTSAWEYVGVYADEAVSGTKDSRKGFKRMIEDCRSGKIDLIITKSISRFARNHRHSSHVFFFSNYFLHVLYLCLKFKLLTFVFFR